jgi:hypothetical protein
MISINRKFRSIDAGLFDRVAHLLESSVQVTDKELLKQVNHTLNLQNIRPNPEKFKVVIGKLESHLLKNSQYNFVIKNLPSHAESKYQGRRQSKVTYSAMRDTLNEFGKVTNMFINHGVGYFTMDNHRQTHDLINNMQLGRNIIRTVCV